ncbi:hypothetical protein B0H65DRAFT_437844 [Neurospora tetraspora]|uniref:Uncharacterized protein n=1 Tax=Neurospora tetraspora TaxID=94610 RepID=A0AAE0JNM1_9PEZI|nr:hypothetical protein B0H65DRAFT_437844 [Neurospora tetraspora]
MQRGPTGNPNFSVTSWCSIIPASVGRTKGLRGGHSANSGSMLGNVLGAWLVLSWLSFVIPDGGWYGIGTRTGRQPEDAICNSSHTQPVKFPVVIHGESHGKGCWSSNGEID